MRLALVLVLVIATTVVRAEYPANFPKCHNGDSDCLTKTANEVIHKYSAGLREINLLPMEPLHIKIMNLDRNPSSPVNADFSFHDLDLFGFKSMKVSSFTGLQADFSGRTSFEAIIPELRLKGGYNLEGRVLLLPIVGNGPCEIKIKNMKIKYGVDVKPLEKNGQTYATCEHTKLDMDVDHMQFRLENLFNGNQELGENMNKFMNENWQEIFTEIKASFAKAFSLVVKSYCNNFFDKYPYADHFL